MGSQLQINPDGSERLTYNAPDFPVRCFTARLSDLPRYAASCHWHSDFEFLIAREGDIDYFVNGSVLTLRQGQGIFVNSNRLHYGFSSRMTECLYSCLVFHPSMLGALPLPMARYTQWLGADKEADYLLLDPAEEKGRQVIDLILQILALAQEKEPLYELAVQGVCANLVRCLWSMTERQRGEESVDSAWGTLRQMVGYIQSNYASEIRLEEIAAAGAVCRSKCCRLFREKMDTTPVNYLNNYRLDKAAELLRSTGLSITEIGQRCGFDSSSYFSESFRRRFGITPRDARKHVEG